MIVTMVTGCCVDLVHTYIDKDSMDVVRMFPLKKDTPAVSYRGGGGGIFKIDLFHLTLLTVQQLTLLCIILNANQRTKIGGGLGMWPLKTNKKAPKCTGITTYYVCV